ncbi:MAG: hypothetical protein IT303_15180 [Dehalococcoidia bacterium]|nr:hypothetical protein [Dehalococcoidia bacterium]
MDKPMRRGYLSRPTVICAWCDRVLVTGSSQVSHGVCEPCADAFARTVDELPRHPSAA